MVKSVDFSLKVVRVLGTNFGSAKMELSLLEDALSPLLLFLEVYESGKCRECIHALVIPFRLKGIFVKTVGLRFSRVFDLTTLKQVGLFPVSSPIFSIFCWKLQGTVSILIDLYGA